LSPETKLNGLGPTLCCRLYVPIAIPLGVVTAKSDKSCEKLFHVCGDSNYVSTYSLTFMSLLWLCAIGHTYSRQRLMWETDSQVWTNSYS